MVKFSRLGKKTVAKQLEEKCKFSPDGKHSWRRVTVCKHCGEWKRK